jgi:peptidoglycan/xylan/chitin deacetylase (PgdA/CDA1 family)
MRVNVEAFDRQICLFKKIGTFIRPDDLDNPERLRKNRLNLLLTFDDGYCNNYKLGLPVLEKHGIPALFFVSTSNMQSGEPFWFDKIIQPIQNNSLESLDLRSLGLKNYHFTNKVDSVRWDDVQVLLEDVKKASRLQDGEIIEEIIQFLHCTCPEHESHGHEDENQPLSPQHIAAMHRSGLCYFGSHSHQHAILTNLSDGELKVELSKSRSILEDVVGEKILSISYPNGNVDDRIKMACMEAGYRYGYTTSYGKFDATVDKMYIPRILIGGYDTTLKVFLKVLKAYLFSKKGK